MANWRLQRVRIEMTRLGAWLIGGFSLAFLGYGTFAAVSLWRGFAGDTGSRVFVAVWLVLAFLLVGNNLRLCVRGTATTRVPPWTPRDLRTPLFRVRPVDE